MRRKIAEEILRLIDARMPFAVATVIKARGSVPGKLGARMIVQPDGQQMGTIGGAGVEHQVHAHCLEAIKNKRGDLFKYLLWHKSAKGVDSCCGGDVEVHVEYIGPDPHVLICGGGHVGLDVARLCEQLEYDYSVYDERPAFASQERFPAARQLHSGDHATAFPEAGLSGFSHVILLGHSHHIDLALLKRIVPVFEGYVGVIASQKKKQEFFSALSENGCTAEQLARLDCPIGIAIGAVTPAEIAVSIMASMIQASRSPQPEPALKPGAAP